MASPLDGIRVLECAIFGVGPHAAAMLGDLGAEVVKVEEPVRGDPARGFTTFWGSPMELTGGRTVIFESSNRNKRGITVNLKTEKGREIIYGMIKHFDVFLHNQRQEAMDRLGLDYETLKGYNPRLIYAAASGYGPVGPDKNKPAFDFMGMAHSGMMTTVGEPGMPPLIITGGICDQMTSIMTVYGVLAALVARERMGVGQAIHASMLGGMINLQAFNVNTMLLRGSPMRRASRTRTRNPLALHYECGDGKWLAMAHIQSQRYWPDFCRVVGISELETDPRFVDEEARLQNREELISILDDVFATKPRDEWLKILAEGGDFIVAPINDVADLPNDPQALENKYIVDFDHPVLGQVKFVGSPVVFSETPPKIRSGAPELGQHTEEVLQETLGYTWEEMTELREQGII